MAQRYECDICETSVTPEHRIMIQATTLWEDFYDVCDACWDEHFEPLVNAVAQKRPRRITSYPQPETTGPGEEPR